MSRMTLEEKVYQMNQFVGLEHMRQAEKDLTEEEFDIQFLYGSDTKYLALLAGSKTSALLLPPPTLLEALDLYRACHGVPNPAMHTCANNSNEHTTVPMSRPSATKPGG